MLKTNSKNLEETLFNLNEIITVAENVAKPRDLRGLLQEVRKTVEVLSGEVIKHKVTIKIDIPEQLKVQVISSYLDSILLNLLSNAIKYRSKSGPAEINIFLHERAWLRGVARKRQWIRNRPRALWRQVVWDV